MLPSINGLRALSVLLVIISHVEVYYGKSNFSGQLGVNVFFVLSGFLITRLLILEEEKTGSINFKKFYVRRTLRIFPAYYFMLLVYLILQFSGLLYMNQFSWITAITYTKYFQIHLDKPTGHAWSLAIEEHFYLFWPLVFTYFAKGRKFFAFAIILIVPFLRVLSGKYGIQWMGELTIFSRMDALMWGCLFALYYQPICNWLKTKIDKHNLIAIIPFLTIPFFAILQRINDNNHLRLNAFFTAFGNNSGTIADISIGLILLISIMYQHNIWFRFLNLPVLNFIGLLSYSLYLWQQLFTLNNVGILSVPPLNILCILGAALFSYYLIEKPFLKLKTRFKF